MDQIGTRLPNGRLVLRVWRGSRFLGRVVNATVYPAEGSVRLEDIRYHPQAFAAGSFDEEGPAFPTVVQALSFFE